MSRSATLALSAFTVAAACSVFPNELPEQSDASITASGGGGGVSDAQFPVDGPGADVDAEACSADTANDPDNCGSCGHQCASPHVGTVRCSGGKCVPDCESGFFDCNNEDKANDGCETALGPQSCGACYIHCSTGFDCTTTSSAPRGECVCVNGQCGAKGAGCTGNPAVCACLTDGGTVTCRPGEYCGDNGCVCEGGKPCNGDQVCCGSGLCANLMTAHDNCGGCGVRCAASQTCNAGKCQ